jgi:hypothetical protein
MSECRCRVREGTGLAELLAGLALALLIGVLVGGILMAQLRLARSVADRAAAADAVRVAGAVMQGEMRRTFAPDVRAWSADSVAVRAFRGAAMPCVIDGSMAHVRYSGDRLPDARKDSVVSIDAVGTERPFALVDSRPSTEPACTAAPGEDLLQWRLSGPPDDAVALLVFESGSYYLAARALRYRLGAEGRQPLTAERFVHPGTRFVLGAGGDVMLQLLTGRGDTIWLSAPFARSIW